ncbi:MAG: Mur ligase domain-containing protein [Vulcanimicrobiaceae bacterium]
MSRHRHFVGIGGIGMSALARLLLARGERVSGCDVVETPLIARLRVEGAQIAIGHHAAHLGDADSVIVSSAIDRQNPEIVQARRLGLPVVHRGELLAELLDERDGIAICGTHGKTTTTAMTHAVLRAGGIDAGLALGGIDIALDTNAWPPVAAWFVT